MANETGSTTDQLRAVKAKQELDEVRSEYEAKEQTKLVKSVYSQRSRLTKLEEEMIKMRHTLAILKWVGTTIGGLLATGLAAAVFGGCV